MLEQLKKPQEAPSRKKQKKELSKLQSELAVLQQELSKSNVPVIIIIEGFSASGKGQMMSKLISELDPRFYQVYSTSHETFEEKRRPLLWGFWNKLPSKGKMAIFDRSWYNRTLNKIHEEGYTPALSNSINTFERQLIDDGYLVLKFFLYITQKEQKKRLKVLRDDPSSSWRVTERDWRLNKNYEYRYKLQDELLESTNTDYSPWHAVINEDDNSGAIEILQIIKEKITSALSDGVAPSEFDSGFKPKLNKISKLSEIDLSPTVTDSYYKSTIKKEREKLQKLHGLLYKEKIPVILAFEGWDAAGKGGAIRRLSWALDPRGFDVTPISAPTSEEINRHYLWRFWNQIPKDGHIALFDRTWYGRVMVERVEKFTSETRWSQAYNEINEFEKELADWGAIIIKFWIHIDKQTQLERFEARQMTPSKQYKITDDDWRNREKWDLYESAIDEMISKTSTEYAPWVIVEGNDKKFARLKVIKTVREALEKRLADDDY